MDRYQKVEKPKADSPINQNEIWITSQGRMHSYITYAMALLQEKGLDEIVFRAMGRAIYKAVTIVELIKGRIVGLHQITAIQSIDITDTWEPLEEGLQILETTRKVSMITITLSKKELEKTNIGYQPPIPDDQVKVPTKLKYDGEDSPIARGRGRGGNNFASAEFEDGGYEKDHGYTSGRGRGRGCNFRGRVRGGYYSGPRCDTQHDNTDGYNQEAPRGRGRGKTGDPVEEVEHRIITLPNDRSCSKYHLWHGANHKTLEGRTIVDDFRYTAGKALDLYSRGEIPRILEIHNTTSQPIEEFKDPKLEMVDSDDEDIISWIEPPPPIPVIEILSTDDEE
ncbi:hypothetical protein OROGR_016569 [Orobanche gracilis]